MLQGLILKHIKAAQLLNPVRNHKETGDIQRIPADQLTKHAFGIYNEVGHRVRSSRNRCESHQKEYIEKETSHKICNDKKGEGVEL